MTTYYMVYGSTFIRNFQPVAPRIGSSVVIRISDIISDVFESPNVITNVEVTIWGNGNRREVIVSFANFSAGINEERIGPTPSFNAFAELDFLESVWVVVIIDHIGVAIWVYRHSCVPRIHVLIFRDVHIWTAPV